MDARSSTDIRDPPFIRGQTAAELVAMWEADHSASTSSGSGTQRGVITFCQSVDLLFGGEGIPIGELTEIAGPPGIGKTQFGMQLALNVQIPHSSGGLQGSAVYIDTEGSLSPERCYEMARELWKHCITKHETRTRLQPHVEALPTWFSIEGLLAGIQVLRVHDVATLDTTISSLETICKKAQRPIRMVIVDSLAFPVRAESTNDFLGRTQQLTRWAMQLSQYAQSYPPKAVVVLNQMTTTTNATGNQASSNDSSVNKENSLIVGTSLTPALGEAWAHAVTNRIVLAEGSGDTRICRLVKSPRLPSRQTQYQVVEGGIRDVRAPANRARVEKT